MLKKKLSPGKKYKRGLKKPWNLKDMNWRIDITVKSKIETIGYNDDCVVTYIPTGEVKYNGPISVFPNPFSVRYGKITDYIQMGYPIVADGKHEAKVYKSPKHGRCLLLFDRDISGDHQDYYLKNRVRARNRLQYIRFCEIHSGGIKSKNPKWRGSTGCLTIPPDRWEEFIAIFADNTESCEVNINTIKEIKDKEPPLYNTIKNRVGLARGRDEWVASNG